MAVKRVSIEGFAKEVTKSLKEFDEVTIGDMKDAVDRVAKESVKDVKSNIAAEGLVKTGDYRRSFAQKKASVKTKQQYSKLVYSRAPEYRLTHLLEEGHLTRTGKRQKVAPHMVQGKVHIAPVDEAAAEKLERCIREAVKGG